MQNKIATNNTLKTVSGLMASQYRAGNALMSITVLRDANASNDFKEHMVLILVIIFTN